MRAAAGGLTLRRGDSAAAVGPSRLISIAVVGLSGSEKDKGSVGAGKSCLCNRFVQPLADDYSVDHISVFSQSDFSGRVVNNDHFLYWGDARKQNEEGADFHIQVVEQTEFIDDASFQPFRGSGKSEPYVKRCSATKLISAEKLMYICKDQLALESEYEQRVIPDGRFAVEGFLIVFDVSLVPNRIAERQVEFTAQIINNVLKSKKPFVIAATKCDEANEVMVRELERLVNRKELKSCTVPVIETSSHENINVDQAFFVLAQLIDKTRGRSRIVSYMEAAHARRELLDVATEGYVRLLRLEVRDYGALWSVAIKKLVQYHEYQAYAALFGKDSAQRLFKRHVKKLKDEFLGEKVQRYFDLLPEVLREMFPNCNTLGEGCEHLVHFSPNECLGCRYIQHRRVPPWDWSLVKQRVREHHHFDHFFIDYPEDTTWMEADLFDGDTSENRIPFAVLEMPDAETVFKNHLNQLMAHHKIMELRHDFKKMLEEMGCVTPGKALDEVKVLFLGRECFENLPENEIVEIYDIHQRELIQKSKKNFQELLLERADLFSQFRSSPAGTVTQDDILDIIEALQEDSRSKALDRLDSDRKLILFQHLGFVHCPIREHCPAFPHCTDSLVERIVAKKAQRPPSWSRTSDNNHLNLVILGSEGLSHDLEDAVKAVCDDDEFEHENQIFSLDYRTISGDVALPENAFRTQDFLPHGCFCTFSDDSSFEYIRNSLEKTLLSNLEQEDRLPFQGLPLVIVFAANESLGDKDLISLREEGQALADSLQCPFIDVCLSRIDPGSDRFDKRLVEEALRALIESIRRRSGLINIYKSAPNNVEPDIRIIMCLLCGDPYSVENVLGPLLKQSNCYLSGERSVAIETTLGGGIKRKVEVILSSYHSADDFREELVHGFILVYSTRRKASLATLSTFSMDIPELPIQVLAVSDNTATTSTLSAGIGTGILGGGLFGGVGELEARLVQEGGALADRLNAHFVTSNIAAPQKTSFYTPFFQEVFDKKSEIEHAFSMEDGARLDDSGEGTLERPRRQPMPPPRFDSYRLRGPLDDAVTPTSEDSDVYSQHMDSIDRQQQHKQQQQHKNGAAEHLVKPSQIKNKKRQQQGWVDDSIFIRRSGQDEDLAGSVNAGAFTTGRRARGPPPVKPRSQIPGKLNLSDFHKVTTTLSTMQLDPSSPSSSHARQSSAPLALTEDIIDHHGYAVPRDMLPGRMSAGPPPPTRPPPPPPSGGEYAQPIGEDLTPRARQQQRKGPRERREQLAIQQADESDSLSDTSSDDDEGQSSSGQRSRSSGGGNNGANNRRRKKRATAIPVATPKVPMQMMPPMPPRNQVNNVERISPPEEIRAKFDEGDGQDLFGGLSEKDMEKQRRKLDKELKQRQKDAERRKVKDEKKRLKEEKEKRDQEAKDRKKEAKTKMKANSIQAQLSLDDFKTSPDNPIPVFLEKALTFIEKEGLDAEGLYRVPGNRAHVDLLFQKFDEDNNVDITSLDIAVNAVATAVKDFFFKRLPPVLGQDHMSELEAISVMPDRSIKILELAKLLKRLPKTNFAVLKFIFQHFVRVTELSKDNCMDSKNLAICWWPTLLQYEFGDLGKFEAMRPHLEDIVQTMIDQFRFLFCGQEEVMMV